MKLRKKIAIVIPAYNAERTITKVIERIPRALAEKAAIIIVDDGSTDNTCKKIKGMDKSLSVSIIRHRGNKGYGAAQKTGFNEALKRKAEIVAVLHADCQYPAEMLAMLIEPISKGKADITAGSRIRYKNMLKQGMPLHKYAGNIILTKLLNMRFNCNLSSYHSGFKAYSRNALRSIDFRNFSDYFYFDTEMLIGGLGQGLEIREIPIPTIYGNEKSYLNPAKYGIGIIKIIMGKEKNEI